MVDRLRMNAAGLSLDRPRAHRWLIGGHGCRDDALHILLIPGSGGNTMRGGIWPKGSFSSLYRGYRCDKRYHASAAMTTDSLCRTNSHGSPPPFANPDRSFRRETL